MRETRGEPAHRSQYPFERKTDLGPSHPLSAARYAPVVREDRPIASTATQSRRHPTHVLIAEDDLEIAEIVSLHLRAAGHAVRVVRDGQSALARCRAGEVDLLILDLTLEPGLDGLDVCRRMRQGGPYVPILMLTARSSVADRVLGLELGADDYLAKPFSVQEIVARVGAILRRVDGLGTRSEDDEPIRVAQLEVDPLRRRVVVGGRRLALTPREFDLLAEFASHPGRVFTRAQLLDRVWGYASESYEHTVNSHISRLRTKIEADPSHPRYLRTVWGVGYRFTDPDDGD